MALTNMEVFNEYFMSAAIDRLEQKVQLFNEASAGALRLSTTGFVGDFLDESFFAALTGAQARVNRYGANNTVTPIDLSEDKIRSVKVAGRYGPIRYEPSQFSWLKRPTAQAVSAFAAKFSDAVLKDMVNTAIGVLVAALNNNADVRYSAAPNAITFNALNESQALFGDASENIVASVMTGKTAHKIIGQNLTNTSNLFTAGNVRVLDILGMRVIRTDAPALFVPAVAGSPGTPAQDYVLGLTESAAIVTDAATDIVTAENTSAGKERIETIMQTDYAFGLKLKGYSWAGSPSPTQSQLYTGTNWTFAIADIKNSAGVLTVGQAA